MFHLIFSLIAAVALAQTPAGTMAFTVSMDQPSTHYYHVEFHVAGLRGESQDFKLPVWMPGYYRIMDYSKDVINFKAADGAGHPLTWAKTTKNTWHVNTANAPEIVVTYDVYAFTVFVGNSYLDDQHGYLVGPATYMHVAGMINHPVTVTFKPYKGWTTVANGLDPVQGKPFTFSAPDFDLLYDCPTMLGNQERFQFDVKGVPHYVVMENVPKSVSREQIAADLKKIVTAATELIGDIPYKHYTFLCMGKGAGGVEHLTSAAMLFNGDSLTTPQGYHTWLGFAAHEYFHTFNVKRIRPIALGPFDYDHENFTNMLWVSEGFTSYYSALILERAGLTSRQQYLDTLSTGMARLENTSAERFQSVAQSSMDTWTSGGRGGGSGDENAQNTTISYYAKGGALAPLLDLKIRHETQNRKSLDDVMRTLYSEFFQEKKRGFTDAEFRLVCERIAGSSLAEFFDDYVYSTKDVDWAKYFAYAGLKLDRDPHARPGAYLGADVGNNQTVTRIEWGSPAQENGLSAQDQILAIDGVSVAVRRLDDFLKTQQAGDTLSLLIVRNSMVRELRVTLGQKAERTFKASPIENASALETAILKGWLN